MNSAFENAFETGLKHLQRKDYALALSYFVQASKSSPDHCGTWGNIGFCLSNLNKHEEAIKAYQKLIGQCPEYSHIARISIGECELALGNIDRAAKVIDSVLKRAPHMPEAWIAASNYYSKIGNHQKLRICSEKAIDLDPSLAVAHLNLGWALLNMKDYSAALTATKAAIKLDKGCIQALVNASTIYLQAGDYENSIAMATKALSLQPVCAEALLNIAKVHKEQGNPDTALATLDHLSGQNAKTLLVKSEILNDIGETNAAIYCLQRAMNYDNGKTHPEVLHSLGTLLLKRGEFDTGFKLYEYRKKPAPMPQSKKVQDISVGSNIRNHSFKTLIRKEQGIGDNILFASLIPEALKQGGSVYLEADSRLHGLYRRSFGTDFYLIENDNPLNQLAFDEIISIGSLGYIYRFSKEDFGRQAIGYLKADQQKSSRIRRELINNLNATKIIGLSWFSAGLTRQNRKKCISLRRLMRSIESQQDCAFINLQYGWKDCSREDSKEIEQSTNIYTPEIDLRNDLDGVASYLYACDLIITVSTTLAHLACALGKETYVLLPLSAIWHWGSEPERTVWYPTAKLYRQEELDSWEQPLARLSYDLLKSQG